VIRIASPWISGSSMSDAGHGGENCKADALGIRAQSWREPAQHLEDVSVAGEPVEQHDGRS
jgi:hypothetical protein